MKCCVIGVGAVGGTLAALLTEGGVSVSAVARGATLRAIEQHGLRLDDVSGSRICRFPVSNDPRSFGPQDCVLIATKAHAIPDAVGAITPLLGPHTTVISVVNGIPWWYFHGQPHSPPKRHLDAVDPAGRIWRTIGPERAIGCVTYIAATLKAPGHVHHTFGYNFIIGEPDGTRSERLQRLSEALSVSGLQWPVSTDIRGEMWLKLWGNLSANPISAVARARMREIVEDDLSRALVVDMMAEAERVAAALGVAFPAGIEDRIAEFDKIADFKTSMLQDVEAGRSVELDPIVGAVAELGRIVGVATPKIDAVYALARLQAKIAGLYPA